jgi:hypothetical protein
MAENPEVAGAIPTVNIEAFKRRLGRAINIDDIPLNMRTASDKAIKTVKAVKSAGQFTNIKSHSSCAANCSGHSSRQPMWM